MDNPECLSHAHLLYLAAHRLRLLIEQKIKENRIGFHSWLILVCIHNETGKLTQRQLAQRLGLKDPSVGVLVKQLMRMKYLARTINAEDRRKYAIKITEQGAAVYDDIQRTLAPVLASVFANHHEEMHLLRQLLQNIVAVGKGDDGLEE